MDLAPGKILKKDASAFVEAVKTYERGIFNYLYRLCGCRDDALDLTQDTFIKAYNNLHKLNSGMDIKPWIYRIAHNNFIDFIRVRKIYVDISSEEFTDYTTAEDAVIAKDTMKAVDEILKSLPFIYKSVFLLRTIDDLSFREISIILKTSESNARMRYLRVRKRIAAELNGGDIL